MLGILLGSDDSYIDTLIVKDKKELITDKGKKREGIEACGNYSGQRRQLFCFRTLSRTHLVPWNCQFCHKSKRYHQEVASEFCYIPSTPSSTSPGNKWKMVWRWKGERDWWNYVSIKCCAFCPHLLRVRCLLEIGGLAKRDCISVPSWVSADGLADLFSVTTGVKNEGWLEKSCHL